MKIVEERPTASYGTMTTRVRKRSKLKTLILSILGPIGNEYKSSLREARGTTDARTHCTKQCGTEPWTRWVEDDHSDSESDDDDNGRMEKLL
jgi:hypothetical protein